jgi:hypothetical protein
MTDYLDAATPATVTSITAIEIHTTIDADTPTSKTKIPATGADIFTPYPGSSATISSVTTVVSAFEEYVHPTGSWGPFDDDDQIIS